MGIPNRGYDVAQYIEFDSGWFDLVSAERIADALCDPEQFALLAGCPEYEDDITDYYRATRTEFGGPRDEFIISEILKAARAKRQPDIVLSP